MFVHRWRLQVFEAIEKPNVFGLWSDGLPITDAYNRLVVLLLPMLHGIQEQWRDARVQTGNVFWAAGGLSLVAQNVLVGFDHIFVVFGSPLNRVSILVHTSRLLCLQSLLHGQAIEKNSRPDASVLLLLERAILTKQFVDQCSHLCTCLGIISPFWTLFCWSNCQLARLTSGNFRGFLCSRWFIWCHPSLRLRKLG